MRNKNKYYSILRHVLYTIKDPFFTLPSIVMDLGIFNLFPILQEQEEENHIFQNRSDPIIVFQQQFYY
jgi:hypothetical protein